MNENLYSEWSSIRLGLELFSLGKVIRGEYEAHAWGVKGHNKILYAYSKPHHRQIQAEYASIQEKAAVDGYSAVVYLGKLSIAQAIQETAEMDSVLDRRIASEVITHRYVRPVRNITPKQEYL